MTADSLGHDAIEQRLAEIFETEATAIPVNDAWEAIARRALVADSLDTRPRPTSATRWRRPAWGGVAAGLGVAAAIVLVVILGGRLAVPTPVPVPPATKSVPRYDPSIPTLVVYRTTAGWERPLGPTQPAPFTLTPERMRTESPEVGRAALTAMFETTPVPAGNPQRAVQKIGRAAVASVTESGGVIHADLDDFAGPEYVERDARVIAQAWVRTLQDTLGVRDDVLITLQGRPFLLYGSIDTAKPLTRDDSVGVIRPDGFDSPRDGEVAPSTLVLLGSVTAGGGQPALLKIVNLDTGAIAYEQELPGPADRSAPIDFGPVLTLDAGRYRATVSGHGAVKGAREIIFTVVP